ncbi:hypothetical protein GOODEAATRI_030362, partial [Goodea atripinnis]
TRADGIGSRQNKLLPSQGARLAVKEQTQSRYVHATVPQRYPLFYCCSSSIGKYSGSLRCLDQISAAWR